MKTLTDEQRRGRTRIFPWQPPQTLHDSINIVVNPYPYILQTL